MTKEQFPEIVVISLARAANRRQAIQTQFNKLELPFRFFEAIDGQQGHPLFERYNPKRSASLGELPLTAGHLGCYASHFKVWEECSESGTPYIVLEDDAQINPDGFQAFINLIPWLTDQVECVRLFPSRSRNTDNIPLISGNGLTVAKFLRGHKSATAYYLTPRAADKFITHAKTWCEPVDIEMDQFWWNKVECFGLLPACVTNNPEFDSAIDSGIPIKDQRTGTTKLRWRLYMIWCRINRTRHNLLTSLKK